jgi:prophage tail gpP-like protein
VSDLKLLVAGREYGGWTSISVDLGIDQAANGFDLGVTERWAGQDVARPIKPGAACTVTIGGGTVITGYVDDVDISYDAGSHTVNVRGRDKTGDIVDCSAIHQSGAWANAPLDRIAKDLCAPFGIGVQVETHIGEPFPKWQIQEGETVFECIERAARMRGVLLNSDGQGNLVITRASSGSAVARLELGKNILSASGQFSWRDRHSDYTIKGQSSGTDEWSGEQAAHPTAKAKDSAIARYRPLIVVGEDNGDPTTYARRAEWERNVRYGKSARVTATVNGWGSGGQVWRPNRMVQYVDAFMGVNEVLIIARVRLSLDDSGERAELELTRREAYDVEPLSAEDGVLV